MTSTVGSKGQVTIPQKVRVRLGLREGDRVEFVTERGETVIRPARRMKNPFEAYVGVLGTFPGGVKEINAWVAELREEKPKR